MNTMARSTSNRLAFFAGLALLAACRMTLAAESPAGLTMVVMDPLAKPLSCPCVQGYAQRDYERLASKLSATLGQPVRVAFNESLKAALDRDTQGRADIVIGKRSVVLHDATQTKLQLIPLAALTNKEGGTTMNGLIVVPASDPAQAAADLRGYRLIFGPVECDEKHAAALALLKQAGVELPGKLETAAACDEGAVAILDDAKQGRKGAAVISSYAAPLLEGCGTVPKGALRVVGKTAPVPFIEVFVRGTLAADEREKLTAALLKSTLDLPLRMALESRDGFVPIERDEVAAKKK